MAYCAKTVNVHFHDEGMEANGTEDKCILMTKNAESDNGKEEQQLDMEDDYDNYFPTINSDNESVHSESIKNCLKINSCSDNESLHEEEKQSSSDDLEFLDLEELFPQQMDIEIEELGESKEKKRIIGWNF